MSVASPGQPSPRQSSLGLLVLPFFLWGTAMVAMKGTLGQTTPFFLATVRLLPAGGLVLLAGWLLGRSQPRGWRAWLGIVGFALLDGTLFQGFLAQGLARTSAGLGSVMIDSQPLAVALMACWWLGETMGRWGWLGLGLGLAGITLLGLPDEWIVQGTGQLALLGLDGLEQILGPVLRPWLSVGSGSLLSGLGMDALAELSHDFPGLPPLDQWLPLLVSDGQGLMLLASLSMAGGTVVSRVLSRWVDPVMATGWHMVLGALPLGLLSIVLEQGQVEHLRVGDWWALGYSTVFGSAVAYALFFYFAARGSLTSLSALTFLTPIFALFFGVLFLQESLSSIQWSGVGLTLVSIYLINQRHQLGRPGRLSELATGDVLAGDVLAGDAAMVSPVTAEAPAGSVLERASVELLDSR